MKRILLLLCLSFTLSAVKASDTLIVKQVFAFNVGDTFDYKIHFQAQYFTNGLNHEMIDFDRIVITSKSYSIDSQTLTYDYTHTIYGQSDSSVYQYIDTDIIRYDTTLSTFSPIYVLHHFDTGLDSLGLIYNSYSGGTTDNGYSHQYTQGLGLTYASKFQGNQVDGMLNYDTSLIYFSQGGMSHGTPYYNQYYYLHPLSIATIDDKVNISISPNPATTTLHISLSQSNQNYQFTLTDLLGKELLSQPITHSETSIDISNLANGIYTWRLTAQNETIKTGKVVKQ